jgi:VanZ family protein
MMTGARGAPSRAPSRVFVLAMVVFIIYGSLYPFDFLAEPLPIDRFYAEWRLFDNTGDAVDNFILFVPLGIGLHIHYASTRARWVASVLSVLVLAIGVQLVQLYLPSRTSAVSDAVWNTVGLVAGLMVAARVRPLVAARMSREGVAHDYFALLLVALWFIYESFPFVPTLDIGELRGHIKTAIVAPPFEFMRLAQHGLAALMAGVAVQRTNWLLRRRDGVLLAGGIAITLEILVAYGSLRRETLLGIALGMATAYWLARRRRGNAVCKAALARLAGRTRAGLVRGAGDRRAAVGRDCPRGHARARERVDCGGPAAAAGGRMGAHRGVWHSWRQQHGADVRRAGTGRVGAALRR